MQLVLGNLLIVDEEIPGVAGRQLGAHHHLAEVEVAGGRVGLEHGAGLWVRRAPGAREGDDDPHQRDSDQGGDDQTADDRRFDHRRRGSWARGKRWSDAKSRPITVPANISSTARRASGIRGASRAATPTENSHRRRPRKAHAWRRTTIKQIGYL